MNDDIKTIDQLADDEILETINAALDTALQGDRREAENMLLDLFVHGPSAKRGVR